LINKILSLLKWNIFIIMFCGSYGDIMFFTALEFRTFRSDELASVMSFFVCLGMNVLAMFILFKIIHVNLTLKNKKGIKKLRIKMKLEKDFEKYKAVFECYKDKSFDQQIFLALYILRVSLFNIIIAYLYKHPLIQAILITILNFAFVVYLIVKKPMRKLINLLQQLTIEIVLLVFNVCVLILSIADNAENPAISLRKSLGNVMTTINLSIPIISMGFIVVKLILIIREVYISRKQPQVKEFEVTHVRHIERSPSPPVDAKLAQSPIFTKYVQNSAFRIADKPSESIRRIKSRRHRKISQENQQQSIFYFFLFLINL